MVIHFFFFLFSRMLEDDLKLSSDEEENDQVRATELSCNSYAYTLSMVITGLLPGDKSHPLTPILHVPHAKKMSCSILWSMPKVMLKISVC